MSTNSNIKDKIEDMKVGYGEVKVASNEQK